MQEFIKYAKEAEKSFQGKKLKQKSKQRVQESKETSGNSIMVGTHP